MKSFYIVTPTYNQGCYLQQNIDSIQSSSSLVKHSIIDGSSTDSTLDVINLNENSLFYWLSEPDSGQSEAINKGFSRRSGDYLTWINSDDYYLPGALDTVSSLFDHNPEIDVIHGGSILVDKSSSQFGLDYGQSRGLPFRYYSGMCFPQPSSFIRKRIFDKIGCVNENLHYAMDYELFLKLKLIGASFMKVDNLFSAYRYHESSKTVSSPLDFADEWLQVYCNFIHDEYYSSDILNILNNLCLAKEQNCSYERSQYLSKNDLLKTLFYALHYQCFYRYAAKQYSVVLKIIPTMLSIRPFGELTLPLIKMYTACLVKS